MTEHEAWKLVLPKLPDYKFVCITIKFVVPDPVMREAMIAKVMRHKNYRTRKVERPAIWPGGTRGNLCRRLFVERMIRETQNP